MRSCARPWPAPTRSSSSTAVRPTIRLPWRRPPARGCSPFPGGQWQPEAGGRGSLPPRLAAGSRRRRDRLRGTRPRDQDVVRRFGSRPVRLRRQTRDGRADRRGLGHVPPRLPPEALRPARPANAGPQGVGSTRTTGGDGGGRLAGPLFHHSFRDFEHVVSKLNASARSGPERDVAAEGCVRGACPVRAAVLFLQASRAARPLARGSLWGGARGDFGYGRWLRDVKVYEAIRMAEAHEGSDLNPDR